MVHLCSFKINLGTAVQAHRILTLNSLVLKQRRTTSLTRNPQFSDHLIHILLVEILTFLALTQEFSRNLF